VTLDISFQPYRFDLVDTMNKQPSQKKTRNAKNPIIKEMGLKWVFRP
jgi:hypothetical protein